MANNLILQAISAIKFGDKAQGQELLLQILEQDSQNESAWFWLSKCASNNSQKFKYLKKVLEINPRNSKAKEEIALLRSHSSMQPQPKPPLQNVASAPSAQPAQPAPPLPPAPPTPPVPNVSPEESAQPVPSAPPVEPAISKPAAPAAPVVPAEKEAKSYNTLIKILVTAIVILGSAGMIGLALLIYRSVSPPVATSVPGRSLPRLALTEAELEFGLQAPTPLQAVTFQNRCDSLEALDCFNAHYLTTDGDMFVLLLGSFSNREEAVDFGTEQRAQLATEKQVEKIYLPETETNHLWLMVGSIGGAPIYYGGAVEDEVAIYMIWSRSSTSISEDEAIDVFSRLFEAQIRKISLY